MIATLKRTLKGKQSLPANVRRQVVAGVQSTQQGGLTGTVAFDQYGDITAATFTLYQVTGSPPAWTAVPKSGTTTTK